MSNTFSDCSLVSIVMPCYNSEEFIRQSIESVFSQTYSNYEILVIDDHSQDKTVSIVRQLENLSNNRIRLFVNKQRMGAAYCRNKALREAKGRWVAFLDSDDMWLPDKLEKQIAFMEKGQYLFSCTQYEWMDKHGNKMHVRVRAPRIITRRKMLNCCYPGCLTVMYDREKIGEIQILDSIQKRNDWALWLKIIRKCNCYYLDECLSLYRHTNTGISGGRKVNLVKYHYYLYRVNEQFGRLKAIFAVANNLLWNIDKKVRYIRHYK